MGILSDVDAIVRPVRRDKRGRRIGRNWWREYICDLLWNADQAWQRARESEAIGYDEEERQFAEDNPRPTLKEFLIAMKGVRS